MFVIVNNSCPGKCHDCVIVSAGPLQRSPIPRAIKTGAAATEGAMIKVDRRLINPMITRLDQCEKKWTKTRLNRSPRLTGLHQAIPNRRRPGAATLLWRLALLYMTWPMRWHSGMQALHLITGKYFLNRPVLYCQTKQHLNESRLDNFQYISPAT